MCVYSQSLKGSDSKQYLYEGYRLLRYIGIFLIADSLKKSPWVRKVLVEELRCKIENEMAEQNARWFLIEARKCDEEVNAKSIEEEDEIDANFTDGDEYGVLLMISASSEEEESSIPLDESALVDQHLKSVNKTTGNTQ